ncbi:MAG: hypothetical protein WAT79_14600 [Saprospiraceae bacterium]
MNTKNFLISSIAGSVVYFLLGWVFYGMLFKDIYPAGEEQNLMFVYLGCLTFCLLVGYIFTKWAGITQLMTGLYAGALIGLLYGLSMNFFMYSSMTPNMTNMITDVAINAVTGGLAGAVIAYVNGKMQ